MGERNIVVFGVLRVLACVLVWCNHGAVSWSIPAYRVQLHCGIGGIGVDIFFVMSGFLIARILLRDQARGVPWRYFICRRFLRTLPPFILLLAVLGVLELAGVARGGHWTHWCYMNNWYAACDWLPGSDAPAYLGHLWSLCVEEHFYVTLSIAMYIAGPVRVYGAIFLLVPVSAYFLLVGETFSHMFAYVSTITRIVPLSFGVWLAYHESWARGVSLRGARRVMIHFGRGAVGRFIARMTSAGIASVVLLAVGGTMILLGCNSAATQANLRWTGIMASCLFSCGLVLFSLAALERFAARSTWLTARLARDAEIMTYGFYLYHFPIFYAVGVTDGAGASPVRAAIAVGATIFVSAISYYAFERRAIAFGRRRFS